MQKYSIWEITIERGKHWYEIDVSDYISDCMDASQNHVSFALETNVVSPNLEIKIESNNGVKQPQLAISTQRSDSSQFDFTVVENLMDLGYKNGLKMEVLFSSPNGCGASKSIPYYMVGKGASNPYQRAKKADGTDFYLSRPYGDIYLTCMTHQTNLDREEQVLRILTEHIADYDSRKRYGQVVVGFQISNEPFVGKMFAATPGYTGILGENAETGYDERCYCDSCNQKWIDWGFPVDGLGKPIENDENLLAFRKRVLAYFLNEFSKGVKQGNGGSEAEYSTWTRVNFWYDKSDCANTEEIGLYAPNMDFAGPDCYERAFNTIYNVGHATYEGDSLGLDYSIKDNFAYIPENFSGNDPNGIYTFNNDIQIAET